MPKEKRPDPGGNQDQAKKQKTRPLHHNSAEAQRQRLIGALKRGAVNTVIGRKVYDILHVAGRIMELRKMGWPIETHWISFPTEQGRMHRVAQYVLAAEGRPA